MPTTLTDARRFPITEPDGLTLPLTTCIAGNLLGALSAAEWCAFQDADYAYSPVFDLRTRCQVAMDVFDVADTVAAEARAMYGDMYGDGYPMTPAPLIRR